MNKKGIEKEELPFKDFTTIYRRILDLKRDGKITTGEWTLYSYLRQCSNPYGIAQGVNPKTLVDELSPHSTVGYFNKMLAKLKGMQEIYYEERKGRGGSFNVHVGDWPLDKYTLKRIKDKFKEATPVPDVTEDSLDSELGRIFDAPSPKLESVQPPVNTIPIATKSNQPVASHYTDTNTYTHTDRLSIDSKPNNIGGSLNGINRRLGLEDKPQNASEDLCLEICLYCHESSADFAASKIKAHGKDFIRMVFANMKAYISMNPDTHIENMGAYFNKCVELALSEKSRVQQS